MKDGGPAFPIQIVDHISNDNKPGMSLLDWFAGQALAGIVANPKVDPSNTVVNTVAAYDLAIHMLRAKVMWERAQDGQQQSSGT